MQQVMTAAAGENLEHTAEDSRLDARSRMEQRGRMIMRWCCIWFVCVTPLAFSEVGINQQPFTMVSYIAAALFLLQLIWVKVRKREMLLLTVPAVFYLVNLVWTVEGSFKPRFLDTLMIVEFLMLDKESKRYVFKAFRIWLIIQAAGVFLAEFALATGFPLPKRIFWFYSAHINQYYISYYFSYLTISTDMLFPRACGLYNEPGYFGTIAALVLIIENLNLRKIGNLVIFVASLFTMSMAFFALILIYWAIHNYNRPFKLIAALLIALTALFVLPEIDTGNEQINWITQRFTIRDGKLYGDNRTTDQFEVIYNRLYDNNQQWFGWGTNILDTLPNLTTLSYKTYIMRFGWVGFLLIWGTAAAMAIWYARRDFLAYIYIFCFFVSTYQRPHFVAVLYIMLLFGGIDVIRHRRRHGDTTGIRLWRAKTEKQD